MKLIHLEMLSDQSGYDGHYTKDFNQYYKFYITDHTVDAKPLNFGFEIRDYEHFVGVMSKFDPYSFFLAEPIAITEVSLDEMKRIEPLLPEGYL